MTEQINCYPMDPRFIRFYNELVPGENHPIKVIGAFVLGRDNEDMYQHSETIIGRGLDEDRKSAQERTLRTGIEHVVGPGIDVTKTLRSGRIQFNHNSRGLWIIVDAVPVKDAVTTLIRVDLLGGAFNV